MLSMLMIYLAAGSILCGVLLKSVHYFIISYKRCNNQALLMRSMIVGSCLLQRIAPSEDCYLGSNALYWHYPWQSDTYALLLKKNILWYVQGSYEHGVFRTKKRKMVLMQYVKEIMFEYKEKLHYSISLAAGDQTLTFQGVL